MRTIDADALEEHKFVGNKFVINDYQQGWNDAIDAIIDNASTVEPKWIPVSEKLPDLFEVVLVTDECGKVFEYERRSLDDDGNVCDEWCFLGRNIIAWMPLPKPYTRGDI